MTTRVGGPAVALLELESIARGMRLSDVLVKRAPVRLSRAEAVSPGKYLLLFAGGVAEVDEAFRAGVEAAGATLLDKLFLPYAAEALVAGLEGSFAIEWEESLGFVETHTVAAALLSADSTLKRSDVRLLKLDLARGIGGKGVFAITGPLHQVEAGLEFAASAIEPQLLLTTELLSSPSPELKGTVV